MLEREALAKILTLDGVLSVPRATGSIKSPYFAQA